MRKYAPHIFCEQNLICGEGPVWDPVRKGLFWTDGAGDEIYFKGQTDLDYRVFSKGPQAASLALHADGGLVFCGKEGFFHRTDAEVRLVCNECEGIPAININEIVADPLGRVFGGQEAFVEGHNYKPGFLFKVSPFEEDAIVEEGLHIANGMGFNPGLDQFYLVDTIVRNIYRYDYNLKTGQISNRKVLVTLDKEEGLPDGLTVDAEGFIWVARWFGSGLDRYDPDGRLERRIPTPVTQPTSLTFGGKDLNEIYITTASIPWQTSLAPGTFNHQRMRGGSVYRLFQDIQGKREFKAAV